MSPLLARLTTSALHRRASPSSSNLPAYAIVLIVLGALLLLSLLAFALLFLRRRRLLRHAGSTAVSDNDDGWRDSFIPNNFKVVGGIYSLSKSASRSQSHDATAVGMGMGMGEGRAGALSPYQPTTEYGQYRPPLPKVVYSSKPHNPANLVRHARDKSLPLVPAALPLP